MRVPMPMYMSAVPSSVVPAAAVASGRMSTPGR